MNNTERGRDKTIADIGNTDADTENFDEYDEGGDLVGNWTVADYMVQKNGVARNSFDSKLPCINLGSEKFPSWFLADLLWIKPYQIYRGKPDDKMTRNMIKKACRPPSVNMKYIMQEGIDTLGLKAFMTATKADEYAAIIELRPTYVPFRLIQPLAVLYSSGKAIGYEKNAQWNLIAHRFSKTNIEKPVKLHALYEKDETRKLEVQDADSEKKCCARCLENGLETLGMTVTHDPQGCKKTHVRLHWRDNIPALVQKFTNAFNAEKGQDHNLVLFLSEDRSVPKYAAFKKWADQQQGIHTICLLEHKWNTNRTSDSNRAGLMANLAMKVNMKFGGTNQRISYLENALKDTIVLGADVTHPGGGSVIGTPSVAAVVGSVDSDFGKFLGSMRRQKEESKISTEIIKDMEVMVKERFEAYRTANGQKLPEKILYYRDGIDDGQYSEVRQTEIKAIRTAWRKLYKKYKGNPEDNQPQITAVVVTKRHHKRFFPTKEADGAEDSNGNCYPGTCVESGVVSSWFNDFYLQSHNGIQGTAKPAHYFVLEDGMQLGNALQQITHSICYVYARATVGVSYATPAYYADRLCERGRHYLRRFFDPSPAEDNLKTLGKEAAKDNATRNAKDAFQNALNFDWEPSAPNNGNLRHPNLNSATFWM